jgi:hypothetical protein
MSRKAEPRLRSERLAEPDLPSRPERCETNEAEPRAATAATWQADRERQHRTAQPVLPGLIGGCVLGPARSRSDSGPWAGELYAVSNRPPARPIPWRSEL